MVAFFSDWVIDCLTPHTQVQSLPWIRENLRVENGKPISLIDYPWIKFVAEANDDPMVKTINLQACAQIGKSVISRSLLIKNVCVNGGDGIFSSSTRDLAQRSAKKKFWPTLNRSTALKDKIPPEHLQGTQRIDVGRGCIYTAWSGSASTLGDLTCRFGYANEFSKWSGDKSSEADPGLLFLERKGALLSYKYIFESTPAEYGRCRISARVAAGSNGRIHVPCPHCGAYQQMVRGDGDPESGGLAFDRDENGKLDPEIAYRTARYRCQECHGLWEEEDRMPAVRAGVYVPEGCEVDRETGELTGQPTRPYPDWSLQISRFYSPANTFGEMAREYVQAKLAASDEPMRNFVNSWLGEPYRSHRKRQKWEDVAERMCIGPEAGIVPSGTAFLTGGVDVQVDHFVFWISAWGDRGSGSLIDYGTCSTWEELGDVLDLKYRDEEGHEFAIGLSLVDSGDGTRESEIFEATKRMSRPGRVVVPSKGQKAGTMQGHPYRQDNVGDDAKNPKRAKQGRIHATWFMVKVNTNYWQSYVDKCLYDLRPDMPGGFQITIDALHDEDLFEQLTNEVHDQDKGLWVVVNEYNPWDYRDAWRYSRCAAELFVRKNWDKVAMIRNRAKNLAAPRSNKKKGVVSNAKKSQFVTDQGEAYLVTERGD